MHTLTPILAQASGNQEAAVVAGLAAFFAAFFFVFLVIGIVCLIGMWKVFDKAGQPGWAVLIPIYNLILTLTEGTKGSNRFGADPKDPGNAEAFS
mgnify:CR=1 FL=1